MEKQSEVRQEERAKGEWVYTEVTGGLRYWYCSACKNAYHRKCVAPNYLRYGRQVFDKLFSGHHKDTDTNMSLFATNYYAAAPAAPKRGEWYICDEKIACCFSMLYDDVYTASFPVGFLLSITVCTNESHYNVPTQTCRCADRRLSFVKNDRLYADACAEINLSFLPTCMCRCTPQGSA